MKCKSLIPVPSLILLSACVVGERTLPEIAQDGPPTGVPTAQDVSIQALPYERGTVYQLRAAVGDPGTIALQPGETLVNYAAGDGELWIIDAANADDRTRLRIEPTRTDVSTPLLINTDRRSYLVEATSRQQDEASPTLTWTYTHEATALPTVAVEVESETPAESEGETAFSWKDWFAGLTVSTSDDPRGCRLCRDSDDHGDNDHGRDHDRGSRGGMH